MASKRLTSFIMDNIFQLLLLAAVSLAVFGQSLGHDFLVSWDDPGYVTKNEVIKSISPASLKAAFGSFYVGNYAPLQIVSYMIDHALWGMRPVGFILGNIFCHTVSGLLLYGLLRRFSFSATASVLAALLFLLHPVQVESVVWISQRKNVLCMVFYLLSFHLYLDWFRREGGNLAYAASIFAFVAALLVKSVAVIFPLTLLLHDLSFRSDRRQGRFLADKLPYILAALAVGYLALLTQSAEYNGGGRTGFHGGSPWATLLTMLPVFMTYIHMLVWPAGLSVVYAPPIRTSVDLAVAGSAIVLALLSVLAVRLSKRDRKSFFWAALVPVGLLPVSQVIPLVTLMNDRYLYFPMLGVAACFGLLLDRVSTKSGAALRLPLTCAAAVLVMVLGVLSLQRAGVWQNSMTLWQDAVAKQPASAVAWHMLGDTRSKEGELAAAIAAEEKGAGLCRGVECRLVLRKLSELYLRSDMPDMAKKRASDLLRLFPDAAEGYALEGHIEYQAGNVTAAEKRYLRALELDPGLVSAMQALGTVYLVSGRPGLAIEQLSRAIRLQPPTAELAYSLACAHALAGNVTNSLEFLDEAVRLGYNRPDSILANPELDSIKGDERFVSLMRRNFPNLKMTGR